MPDSTAAETFKMAVFRAMDAAATEMRELSRKVDAVTAEQAHAKGAASAVAGDSERIRQLELAKIDPARMRDLEQKVTRLDVRSGIIGAGAGLVGGAIVQAAMRYLISHLG